MIMPHILYSIMYFFLKTITPRRLYGIPTFLAPLIHPTLEQELIQYAPSPPLEVVGTPPQTQAWLYG